MGNGTHLYTVVLFAKLQDTSAESSASHGPQCLQLPRGYLPQDQGPGLGEAMYE